MIRAMNVLRQYPEASARPALAQLVQQLEPGGLLVEGTCHPFGQVLVVGLYGKTSEGQMVHHGLLFCDQIFVGVCPGYLSVRFAQTPHPSNGAGEEGMIFSNTGNRLPVRLPMPRVLVFDSTMWRQRVLAQRVSGITLKERWLRRGWLLPGRILPFNPVGGALSVLAEAITGVWMFGDAQTNAVTQEAGPNRTQNHDTHRHCGQNAKVTRADQVTRHQGAKTKMSRTL